MKTLRIENTSRGVPVGNRIEHANGFLSRLRGLLGHAPLAAGEGLLLSPCSSIHMIGMRFAIDLLFLDDRGRVLATYADVQPGFQSRSCLGARHALELPAGALRATGTERADVLSWSPAIPREAATAAEPVARV